MFELSQKQAEAYYWLDSPASKVERVFYGGAAGGGKTMFGCAWQIERRIKYTGSKGIIGRKHLTDLKKSTLETYDRVFHEHAKRFNYSYKLHGQLNILEINNGSKIYLADMAESPNDPMFEKFGGWEASDAFIDEAGECSKMGVDTIFSRLRFNLVNDKPALLICSNPSMGWLKNTWIKDKSGKAVTLPDNWKYVRAMLADNPDEKFRKIYENTLKQLGSSQRDRLLYGDWDYMANDTPYYNDFNDGCIIGLYKPLPDFPLRVSFDFNYNPCSLTISQLVRQTGYGMITFEEMQEVGGTRPLAQRLKKWLDNNWSGTIRVTGDASGHKMDTRSGSKTDFDIVREVLGIPPGCIDYANKRNERLGYSRDLINSCFYHRIWKITKNCTGLISDIQNAKPKGDSGEFIKDRENNKLDLLDSGRYFVHSCIGNNNDILALKNIVYG